MAIIIVLKLFFATKLCLGMENENEQQHQHPSAAVQPSIAALFEFGAPNDQRLISENDNEMDQLALFKNNGNGKQQMAMAMDKCFDNMDTQMVDQKQRQNLFLGETSAGSRAGGVVATGGGGGVKSTPSRSSWHNGVNWDKLSSLIGIFGAKSSERWHQVKAQLLQMLHEEYVEKQTILLQQSGAIGSNEQSLLNGIGTEYEKRRGKLITVANVADGVALTMDITTKIFWVSDEWDRQGLEQNFDAKMRRVTCALINIRPIDEIFMQHLNVANALLVQNIGTTNATTISSATSRADFFVFMFKNFMQSIPLPLLAKAAGAANEVSTRQLNLHIFIHFYQAMDRLCVVCEDVPMIAEHRQLILRIIHQLSQYQQIAFALGFERLGSEVCAEKTEQFS